MGRGHILWVTNPKMFTNIMVNTVLLTIFATKFKNPTRQKMVEERLVKMILQQDFWIGIFGIEILIAFIRLNSPDLNYTYFCHFAKINQRLPLVPAKNSDVFVKIVLQKLYEIMAPNGRKKVEQQHLPIENNLKLWATLGVKGLSEDLKSNFMKETATNIDNLLRNQPKFETFYKILFSLKIISSFDSKNGPFKISLVKLLNVIDKGPKKTVAFDNFLAIFLSVIPNDIILSKCQFFFSIFDDMSNFLKLNLLNFVKKVEISEVSLAENYFKLFGKLIEDGDKLIKMKSLKAMFCNRESSKKLIMELVKNPNVKKIIVNYLRKSDFDDEQFLVFLSMQNQNFSLVHKCSPKIETVEEVPSPTNVTLEINAKIDGLFPDESDDDDHVFLHCSSPKKRKIDVEEVLNVILEKARLLQGEELNLKEKEKLEELKRILIKL